MLNLNRVGLGVILLVLGAAAAAAAPPPEVHAYYFTAPQCPSCDKADNLMATLLANDPQVKLHTLNVYLPPEYEVAEALLVVSGISSKELPLGPGLLVGQTYINRNKFSKAAVEAALNAYRTTGAPDRTAEAMPLKGHARESLPQELRRWGLLPFLVAGLLDGINPCAFATLIFFLSYLGMMGSRGWSLASAGLAFAAGVFAAYFVFGLGLLHALWALNSLPLLRWGLLLLMGAISLVFAGLSFRDYRRISKGDFASVTLQLPLGLKQQTHAIIRHGLRARLLYPASFLIGAGVSTLELACTGQVYVPALIYMMSLDETRNRAVGWLLMYDVMFVVPLLCLLLLVLRGSTSKRLKALAEEQAGKTKLYLAVFFVLCAAYFLMRAAGL
ncbi:MAG: hypothetical protein ABFE08_19000 [Armatimonadia bacterium]